VLFVAVLDLDVALPQSFLYGCHSKE